MKNEYFKTIWRKSPEFMRKEPKKHNLLSLFQAFRHHDHPRGSYFHISDTEIDINGVIALFDIPSKCEKRDTEYVKHIQHFPLDDGVVLEVRLYEDQIIGKKEVKEKLGEM